MVGEARYLTLDELIYINEQIPTIGQIHKYLKGVQRVRDMELLETAQGKPTQTAYGEDLYPTVPEKAAALLSGIARNHPFVDGNKRTGTIAALMMLEVNGMCVTWETDEAVERIISLAEGKTNLDEFVAWLPTAHCDPSPEPDEDADKRIIHRLMDHHAELLRKLAER
jgi:death-on-curing protein